MSPIFAENVWALGANKIAQIMHNVKIMPNNDASLTNTSFFANLEMI